MLKNWITTLCILIGSFDLICGQLLGEEVEKWKTSEETLTEEDKARLRSLIEYVFIQDLDERSKYALNIECWYNRISPIKLLEFVLSEPQLLQQIEYGLKTRKKSNLFRLIIKTKISELREENLLSQYISELLDFFEQNKNLMQKVTSLENYDKLLSYFAQVFNRDPNVMLDFIESEDYRGLFTYIF